MSDVSNSFSAWETLPEDEPPLCIAVRRPVSPPRHYEALKFGDARDELKRLTTQLSFRDEQIARLTNHCTLLQIELGTYAERSAKLQRQEGYVAITAKETQTNGGRPDVVPHSDERSKLTEKKSGKSSKPRNVKGVEIVEEERNCQQEVLNKTRFDQDVWEQQAKLMVSLYSELMQIMEEQEVEKKQMTEMEEVLFKGRRAMDDAKSHLLFAYEEIYRLKKNQNMPEETENEEKEVELVELRRLVSALKTGGTEMERQADETTRKLITEQIERIRLSRMNTALRRKSDRAEQTMRRAREKMVIIETHAGKRCAQLQYQLDTALIELANCQSQLVRSVSIETYEKLALRFKKECISEVLESEIDEVWKDSTVSIAAPTDVRAQELEAKNSYLKKIVEVISEQNDFWSKETEILQNENEELKRFVEDMENESDLKNILETDDVGSSVDKCRVRFLINRPNSMFSHIHPKIVIFVVYWPYHSVMTGNSTVTDPRMARFMRKTKTSPSSRQHIASASIEQRLLETIREQQEDRRDHERAYRKAREVEEKLGQERSEWSAQRSRFLFAVRTLQSALSNARLNTLNSLSLIQIEKLKAKIQEIRENEMLVEDNKEKIERMRDKLQQKLALQEGARKAKDAIDEENADVLRLERRLQAVYSSLEMQKVENNRLESTVKLKEAQLSDLKEELTSVKKENEDLMTAIASANLWGKSTENKTVAKDEDHADLEERSSTVIRNSPAKRFVEGSQVSSDDSEASSTDSERGTVKTVLQDNSREFEKRLAKMKEAAELCIQGYKNQLLQKDQAVEMYRQLAEEKLSTRPQNTLEKEIVREEIRVVDEQTEERLRHALGDEEIEELEKANRALYRKRRKSVVPTVDTVDCQTDPIAGSEDNEETKETRGKTKTSSRNSTESTSSNTEDKFEAERQRYKNEIKQLQGRLRRVIGNNKRFKAGNKKLEDEPRSGRPTAISSDELKKLAEPHPFEGVRYFAASLGCLLSTRRQPPKTPGRLNSATDPFEKDEIHEKKVMLSVWWGVHGIYRFELLPDNTTITAEVYCAQLQRPTRSARSTRSSTTARMGSTAPTVQPGPGPERILLPLQHHLEEKRYDDRDHLENDLWAFFASKSPEFYAKRIHDVVRRWQKELTIACEKIRDDAMAELEVRVPRTKEVDEQAMIRIRVEFDKARKENRALRKIIEKQKISLESFKKEVVLRKSGEEEMARWIERKKLEESLSSVRKKLVDSLEKEKVIREKLSKRERILEEFRRDEEVRQRELDRTRKKCAELQYERDKALRENTEVHVLQKKLLEESAKLEQNEKVPLGGGFGVN
ncbi:hypothetical protein RB195_006206 [Necator americanus]|uniref:Uncharacterized protein n=1 Tax=Necator americanus TaxID=51031 RepID=A0ABR1BSY9_NECAM